MALSPTQNCSLEQILSPQLENPIKKKKKKYKKKIKVESQENLDDSTQLQLQVPHQSSPSSPPRKRTKCPGVRVRGGRIFDSENGKTCHQCRQKTMDVVALCKSQIDGKLCTIKFCHKCLLNRYGENAEEANELEDWKCPKCREICNCSFCMKKKGHQPTGILVHAAKATGFRSVLDMLTVNGPENISVLRKKKIKGDGTQSKKKTHLSSGIDLNITMNEEEKIMAWVDGGENMLITGHNKLKKIPRDKKIKDCKRKILGKSNIDDNVIEGRKDDITQSKKRTKKAHLISEIDLNTTVNEDETTSERVDGDDNTPQIRQTKFKKLARAKEYINFWANGAQLENNTEEPLISIKSEQEKICIINNVDRNRPVLACGMNVGKDNLEDKPKPIAGCKLKTEPDADVSLPWDIDLTTVSELKLPDVELPAEDVLQFLEFCNAFGEELLSKELPDVQIVEPAPCVPLEILASLCNFVHMIS